jgi:RHH-type proline utilization regulon transcriptional repressor/proline dehydrogenase/delta 1-pyrroline-5-carboxylate dehydrogenase
VRAQQPELQLRIYAPVGDHRELLPYLVRRLLENGANASFVHQLHDSDVPVTRLAAHPLQAATEPPALPLPAQLYAPRRNAAGIYLHSGRERAAFLHALNAFRRNVYQFDDPAAAVAVHSPFDGEAVGHWQPATPARIEAATASARRAQPSWQLLGTEQRARCLERAADLLQERRAELVGLMARESGKTLENGLDEVREAVDFCRYYAAQARRLLQPQPLPGPAGEENHLHLEGRGLFACISPWNFPLAIFTGQIAAALVTGNAVLAKPAEQSTLAARLATQLLHRAGVPADVLQLLPGDGEPVGAALCAQPGLDGIVFTGGFDTARAIGRRLLERDGAIIPFIAETAGLNALIADSSALPQQLVTDVLRSAFDSAGQRCSALRVLYLPRATAASIESLLHGAMRQLQLGDPLAWSSDIGPVIDRDAKTQLESHIERFRQRGQLLFQPALPPLPPEALFVPPTTLRLHALGELEREAFGPILHIIHYDEGRLDDVIDEINATGYGLTAGIHSRNEARAQRIAARLRVGNCYINRDTIGAVVGSQPFGGCGKSGTGPKAGGPHYLLRFVTEKTVTLNSAALGGDQRLLAR